MYCLDLKLRRLFGGECLKDVEQEPAALYDLLWSEYPLFPAIPAYPDRVGIRLEAHDLRVGQSEVNAFLPTTKIDGLRGHQKISVINFLQRRRFNLVTAYPAR